jgi:hypothetical protein
MGMNGHKDVDYMKNKNKLYSISPSISRYNYLKEENSNWSYLKIICIIIIMIINKHDISKKI